MPSVTVNDIITRAKAASDQQDDFVTLNQWFSWLTVEHRALVGRIARLGHVLHESYTNISATGAASYTFAEPLAVIGVYEITSNNMLRRVRSVDPFNGHRQTANTVTGAAQQFYVHRDPTPSSTNVVLELFPNPTSGTYRVYFIPHPPTIAALTDAVDYPLGWEERLVLGLARRALAKEESDLTDINQQIRVTEADIEEAVWSRLLGDTPVVRNVDATERGFSPYPYPWPPASAWYFV